MTTFTAQDDPLTIKDVAHLLGHSYKYTWKLISQGVIPRRQRGPGCKITVSRSTIERLFPEHAAQRDK